MSGNGNGAGGQPALVATLKLVAMAAVVLVAGLAILVVLDVVPRDVFRENAVKIGLTTLIVAATTLVIGLLSRSK